MLMCLIVVLAACLVGFAWREREAARLRERVWMQAMHADSIQAARDSSRAVLVAVALRDSLGVYQRRVVQARQRSDSLDRALGVERTARYRIAAEVTELRTRIAASVTNRLDDERSAAFRARDGPFQIEATVTLPHPPGDGQMTVRVAVDTAVIEARVGCGAAHGAGVRSATLSVTGPKWMTLRLGRVEQDPRVCSAAEARPGSERQPFAARMGWLTRRIRIGVGYGAVLAPDGRVIRGPAVAATWSVWP
jgi:hypothetical protein